MNTIMRDHAELQTARLIREREAAHQLRVDIIRLVPALVESNDWQKVNRMIQEALKDHDVNRGR